MKKALLGALLAMATMVAQASSTTDVESSAVVSGTIVLAKDGTVQTAVIDDGAKYGQPIADLVRKAALQWRFQPVLRDGEPVLAKSSMHVRVVLRKMPDGNYDARIKGATFGDSNTDSTDTLRDTEGRKKIPPQYPQAAVRGRVQGTVYLALRVDRSGRVVEAVAEQVNLSNTGPDRVVRQYREILAEAALKAARQWSFAIPTTGPLARQDSWTAHVPVNYNLNALGAPKPDRTWVSYIPGPYTPAPWVDKPDMNAADALADDAVRTDGAGPTLLSPLNHG
ncbi:energy transducer TonB [Rhodanobacter thiooxydans]|uniref:Energy transducer TonB n=1 Tax=Rhodanobacter thiooxydans TaxID=416169 RepID=A0A154QL78_9GAMM|nr:energy transducer TonB [Rhodanobacter thiooxydans]EIM00722.1 TonB family protein [Rhodanobacter thiooxydans LCS2]KZC24901.1 energy transducer TonB [Rhodanobacter thiooxydans]